MRSRSLVISEEFGVYHVASGDGSMKVTGGTLEQALGKAAPRAPEDYLFHASEVLEPLLGKKDSEL